MAAGSGAGLVAGAGAGQLHYCHCQEADGNANSQVAASGLLLACSGPQAMGWCHPFRTGLLSSSVELLQKHPLNAIYLGQER